MYDLFCIIQSLTTITLYLGSVDTSFSLSFQGWSGGAKVLCILHHWGVQLILAYSWARPAILVVGKGRGGNVFISSVSSLSFLFLFLPCPSLSSPLLSLLSLFSLSLGDDTKWPSRVDVSLNPNTINQSLSFDTARFAQVYTKVANYIGNYCMQKKYFVSFRLI